MKKLAVLIGSMALAGGVQAADLSILDNLDAQMMNAEEMATTQGTYCYYCYRQSNKLSQLLAATQDANSVNFGDLNAVFVGQEVYAGNYAEQINID